MNFYRWTLESLASLEPRQSVLEDDFEEEEEKEENDQLDGFEDGAHEKVTHLPHYLTSIFDRKICREGKGMEGESQRQVSSLVQE